MAAKKRDFSQPGFLITGYASSQEVIEGLNTKYKIYLKCDSEIKTFYVTEIKRSERSLTQALIKPRELLTPGKKYKLVIEGLDEYEQEEFLQHQLEFTVGNYQDIITPQWMKHPEFASSYKQYFGCGPAAYLRFCYSSKENSPVLVHSIMREKTTGEVQDMYVITENNLLEIGHGMCSGEFDFEYTGTELYELSFTLLDASGNRSEVVNLAQAFKPPVGEKKKSDSKCPCGKDKEGQFPLVPIVVLFVLGFIMIFLLLSRKKYFTQKEKKNIPALK